MRKLIFLLSFFPLLTLAQNNTFWSEMDESIAKSNKERWIVPDKYRPVSLSLKPFKSLLNSVSKSNENLEYEIFIPMPDGTNERFLISASRTMAPELAIKFPEIQTFSGSGVDDASARIYLDMTPQGFHAMILSSKGTVFIDPYYKDDSEYYVSYKKSNYSFKSKSSWECKCGESAILDDINEDLPEVIKGQNKSVAPVTLKTYNLAVAAQAEYTIFHGGTVASGLAAVVTAINRVTGVYETELAVRLQLVANNNLIIYTNAATDPYPQNSDNSINQNQGALDGAIGNANYDIGHVFNTSGGGLAGLGVVCSNSKADGITGLGSPTGDPFWIDFVAHEIGHQFGGDHTFNGSRGSCSGGNRSGSSAYEPGSGSTIQAYAGICSPQNLQNNSDPYFHFRSLQQMTAHVTTGSGKNCFTGTATGNMTPVVNANSENINGKYIPISTPFELTGSATDANGDAMTYAWEQWDLGPQGNISASADAPIFRTFTPVSSPTRTFPQISRILNNNNVGAYGEVLPTINRDLNFKFIARDNKIGGGGYDDDQITLNVTNAAGPFLVNTHNSTSSISGTVAVGWDVANTTAAPISCVGVDILFSSDGGLTFPTVLASNTPNDGSQNVTLPNINTTTARIKVKCSDNVFFDINNANLTISAATDCDITLLEALTQSSCEKNTNTYDQQIRVTYNDPPATGNLVVNGQTFSITGSPQTVNLINLVADGNAVNVKAAFSDDEGCGLQSNGLFTAAEPCSLCIIYSSSDTPKSIVDNGTSTSIISINGTATIDKVTVNSLVGEHSWINDLNFQLTSPEGTTVDIINRRCDDQDNFDLALDDAAGSNIPCPYNNGGTFKSDSPLSVFKDENPSGNWTLTIVDNVNQDAGQLNSWSLEICINEAEKADCTANNYNLTNVIGTDTFVAAEYIIANGTIGPGGSFFQAKDSIVFEPNFTVPIGVAFEAQIEECETP